MKHDNPPAFPVTPTDKSGQIGLTEIGMTLRDYFAAKAMQAELSGWHHPNADVMIEEDKIAKRAYLMADAMLAARATGGDAE